jgi:hypothetical protein
MVEGYGFQRSFDRSSALTEGSKLRVLLVYGLGYVLYLFVTAIISVLLSQLLGGTLGSLVSTVMMAATYPFIAVVGTMLYFDLRIQREGFDLDLMLDPAAATVPAGG